MAFQGIFRRGREYVAVRPIRFSASITIKPGEDVSQFKEFQLRRWHRMRRIGEKGHPWTESMLANQDSRHRPELGRDRAPAQNNEPPADPAALPDPVKDQRPWSIPGTSERFKTKGEAVKWIETAEGLEEGTEPVNDGLIWAVPDRADRFSKKAEAVDWIKDHYAATQPPAGE